MSDMSGSPRKEIRAGILIISVFFFAIIGWLALAPLDAAVYGEGEIVTAGRNSVIRHREGGQVASLLVQSGDRVDAGQPLLKIVPTGALAVENSISSQVIAAQAQRARVVAEQSGSRTISTPAEFAALPEDRHAEGERALQLQQDQLVANVQAAQLEVSLLKQKAAGLRQYSTGVRDQLSALSQQKELLRMELSGAESLAARGYTSMNRIRALQSNVAGLEASEAALKSSAGQNEALLNEIDLEILASSQERRRALASELVEIERRLRDLEPKLEAARWSVNETQVRAPQSGLIHALKVSGFGDVVSPGQALMEVVPESSELVAEVRVASKDAENLTLGMSAKVRVRSMPGGGRFTYPARVARVSPDTIDGSETEEPYYLVEITFGDTSTGLSPDNSQPLNVRPGIPVSAIIPVRRRTALQYLFEPVSEVVWRSFRER